MAGVGRPLTFQSVEDLDAQIKKYFDTCPEDEWTWTGLALALNVDKHTLTNYKDREEFSTSIKNAMLKVENGYEKDLKKSGRTGTIFALKNFDWKDKQEQEITGKDGAEFKGVTVYLPNRNGVEAISKTGDSTTEPSV